MKAVKLSLLARNLGRAAGVGGVGAAMPSVAGALGVFSTPCAASRAWQHTNAQGASSTTTHGDQEGFETAPKYDPFDLEFDRFNGGAHADTAAAAAAAAAGPKYKPEPLGRPVDIDMELDMDDPESVDLNALYAEGEESPDEEEELLGREVDLDDEYDLIHDRAADLGPVEGEQRPGWVRGQSGAPGARYRESEVGAGRPGKGANVGDVRE